ncbi:bifunctional metallophosphatase/5'-nucleotidase [Mesobacillus selenatarsenatis]|uniref:5'-nucleotidase n=1 Tax=Mesobacillus selenatarsenatis (strain DSM 18680 / JCM 14380 / FERM P-15431 / SF-1) TaxID=1321606 RepID=A0A0A8X486_MESS1|nr:5'-nucleotidase C-terminal domain-containing protein [Mesobacillus selenatarsenatis]GAM14758.1 5'-nucleotidase [Mesobacillus selenatarsenatis SF-1]
MNYRNKFYRKLLSVAASAALLTSIAVPAASANMKGVKPGKPYELTIMHTNDTHAHLDTVANRVAAIKQVREEKANTLLLDAGDVFSGTLYFNEFNGLADLEFMNMVGYDAMTFGNHEFDKGTETLANFVKEANFPFVSANVNFENDENMNPLANNGISSEANDGEVYKGIVKEVNGEKIGIFGLTTAETVDISSPGEDVEFTDYINEAREAVKAFEEQGINKIVALTHIGLNDGGGDNDLTLAEEVDGIDVIVGGHTHVKLEEPIVVKNGSEPTVIVQANEYGKFLGTLDVRFNKNGKIIQHNGELLDITTFPEDAEAAQILNENYKPAVDEIKKTAIGHTNVELNGVREFVRSSETNLGNLITDGMLAKAKTINPNTVIALQNGGGIRESIDAGEITLAEVLTVMPFGNSLAIMQLTGAEIKEALEHSVKEAPSTSGGFLQVAGLKFTYNSTLPVGQRVQSIEVKEDGVNYVTLDLNKTYAVATNTFTAKGGDGYDVFANAYNEGRVSEPGFVDWEVFTEYVSQQEEQTVSPEVEGRIIDIAN